MAKFCEKCGHPLGDSMTFCEKCGHKAAAACKACGAAMAHGERFCPKCGSPAGASAQEPRPAVSQQGAAAPRSTGFAQPAMPPVTQPNTIRQTAPDYAAPAKKSRTGLFWGLGLGAVAIIAVVVLLLGAGAAYVFWPKTAELKAFPEDLKIDPNVIKTNCEYKFHNEIIPANYRSMDYVVYMQCWTDRGRTKLMVTVEIPEFTQKFEQMVEVSRAETELIIHPPLLENAAKSLKSSREAQLMVTVTDMNTGEIVKQDTNTIKLYSRNDILWTDADGTPYSENILAWVTPEAEEIDKMLRDSADSFSELTGGAINSIVGYQEIQGLTHAQITAYQVCSMMYTLANQYQVKYVMAPFSATSGDMQSVKTPTQVIETKGGLCVETAVTMASAIQRTNMHAVIILLPGHAQVAVETWYNSGEYILIETTALDAANQGDFNSVVSFLSKDEWSEYMGRDGYVAIDCALAEKLNIKSID